MANKNNVKTTPTQIYPVLPPSWALVIFRINDDISPII